MKFKNPIGFRSLPVALTICVVYIALIAGLLYVHHVVPAAPRADSPVEGIKLSEAWRDLQLITQAFHPLNSHDNDNVRGYLLHRIQQILKENDVSYSVEGNGKSSNETSSLAETTADPKRVIIFDDLQSNITFAGTTPTSVYFESSNIIVYIRGREDDLGDWWRDSDKIDDPNNKGVLVNAHFDSVSTGLGATDDGVGTVSVLQLIKYYTTPGHQPDRGLVALLNNGEEDYLNGAYAFTQHPISAFPNTFLNLEGAGAGGRAVLFRSTDAEVTQAYRNSPYPFGSVISSDAFQRGLIRSQTDYVIFNGVLGLRGLDVAFFEPRSRYHTVADSARRTSRDSIWHMLSAAIATTKALTSDTHSEYRPGDGSIGVWFDVLGRTMGLMTLKALFALSIALLVVAPVVLIAVGLILRRSDKAYLFARKAHTNPQDPHAPDERVTIEFGGWKGLTRFPIAFVLASAAVGGLGFLVIKFNPLIVYSSAYSVWSMMLSAWLFIVWFFLRGADYMRPTALQRAHSLGWVFAGSWAALVICTALVDIPHIAGVYPAAIYFAAVFAALLVSHLELFALPKRHRYVEAVSHSESVPATPRIGRQGQRASSISSSRILDRSDDRPQSSMGRPTSVHYQDDGAAATETTSLLGGDRRKSLGPSLDRVATRASTRPLLLNDPKKRPYGEEQDWSAHLPSWLWIIEFLLLAPIVLLILGPMALLLTSALSQTPADGSSVFTIYGLIAFVSILLATPVSPFVHRISYRLPLFLLLVAIGTLIYNLFAFPFSEENRLKVFFRQDINVETGENTVSLTGLDGYVQKIISELPSAQGKELKCTAPLLTVKNGLVTCRWPGLNPDIALFDPTVVLENRFLGESKDQKGDDDKPDNGSDDDGGDDNGKKPDDDDSPPKSPKEPVKEPKEPKKPMHSSTFGLPSTTIKPSSSISTTSVPSKEPKKPSRTSTFGLPSTIVKPTSSTSATSVSPPSHSSYPSPPEESKTPKPKEPKEPKEPKKPKSPSEPEQPKNPFASYITLNATLIKPANSTSTQTIEQTEAKFEISGLNTRNCRLTFDLPIADVGVEGSADPSAERNIGKKHVGESGSREVRLWSRTWDRTWVVYVKWNASVADDVKFKGTAQCLWNDESTSGVIPALDEVKSYMPVWSIVTKLDDGLVLGSVEWEL